VEARFTEAPWEVDYIPNSGGQIIIRAEDKDIAIVDDESDLANANLIAAAPDLLAALQSVWGDRFSAAGKGYMVCLSTAHCELIRKAINKALL